MKFLKQIKLSLLLVGSMALPAFGMHSLPSVSLSAYVQALGRQLASEPLVQKAQDFAGKTSELLAQIDAAESVRTALARSCMAVACLADGACSSSDLAILGLACASIVTATSYNGKSEQRYWWLPKESPKCLKWVADGIASVAAYDAGWLPITGTGAEVGLRDGLGYLGMLATGIGFLPK